MGAYVARRVRFRNGERTSMLLRRSTGTPVHEAALFVHRYRVKGRSANTIHQVVSALALLHDELDRAGIDLPKRLNQGRFLSAPEVLRLVDKAQLRIQPGEHEDDAPAGKVVSIERLRLKCRPPAQVAPVDPSTHAMRLRTFADYLQLVTDYARAELRRDQAAQFVREVKEALEVMRAHVPSVSKRAKLGARIGLSKEEQGRLLAVVHPDSPLNPWKRPYVRARNWLIVMLLLATGMRRGELLGLQIRDLDARLPKLRIVRRADSAEDPRLIQPNAKTYDREIELNPAVMKRVWMYVNEDRRAIKAARKFAQIFVSDEGEPLSLKSIDKLFSELRQACPGLPVKLTSHVMRHTWNERFSEEAEAMGLSGPAEEKARANQQGWSESSGTAATYTRRHTERKGREVSLKLQKKLEEKANDGE